MNVAELFEQQARIRPEAPAIVDVLRGRERVLTFRKLNDKATQVAALLNSQGIEAGDGVTIFHPMAAELYIFLIALFRLGAVGLFIDPSAGRRHIQRCCGMFPPKAFFGSHRAHLLRLVSPELRRIPISYGTSWLPGCVNIFSLPRNALLRSLTPIHGDTPALITFTSGSTGTPKAAARTHRLLLAQHRAVVQSLRPTPGTMDLATLPVFVLANLASGVASVLPDADMRVPGSCDPRRIIAQIERCQVKSTAASPAFIERLAEECIRASHSLSSLQRVFIGGGPVFPHVLHCARKVFPNAAITAVYGSTEAEPMAEITLDGIGEEDFSRMRNGGGVLAGAPVPSVQLRVIREQWGTPIGRITVAKFAEMIVPANQPGEIVVSGEHVLGGYLRREGDDETKFNVDTVRWHRTGDLGYLDSRGRLWLLGRSNAKIQDRRGVVYPLTVECAARHDPHIACAALVQFREQRVLVLQPRNAHRLDSAAFKIELPWADIDRLIAVNRIPVDKRHNAKVDYAQLKLLLQRCS
jgi:olefin beta-lactone synthetase